jgi:hypothetical protein
MKEEDNKPSINSDLSSARSVVDLTFSFQVLGLHNISRRSTMIVEYSSLIRDAAGNLSEDQVLSGRFKFNLDELPVDVSQKLESLEKVVAPLLPSYEVGITNFNSLTLGASIREILCSYHTNTPVNIPTQLTVTYSFPTAPSQTTVTNLRWYSLSRSQQLLVSNIASWVKNQAWEHLVNQVRRVSGQPALSSRSHKIFISYKKNSSAEGVAEHIARRLSQQGINVWFDKWRLRAGDSTPGEIGEGFVGSDACLIFLSHEYYGANWCTKEMNTALAKATSEDLIIIPSLVEACDVPELFKDLRRVDFIEPTAAEFEQKLQEITDSIYKVDLNPYR